jgi:gas vesicle protein
MKTWKDFLQGVFAGLIIGLILALFIHSQLSQRYERMVANYDSEIQRANDSIRIANEFNAVLLSELEVFKTQTDSLKNRIKDLEADQQQAETDIAELTPTETTKYFDLRTGEGPETVLLSDTVLTSIQRIREANWLFVVLDYTLEQSTVKTAVIASQDSTIKKLEGVNYNQQIITDQQQAIITKQGEVLSSYQDMVDNCNERRKIDAVFRWVLIGMVLVLIL